jgi:hypothetical protein
MNIKTLINYFEVFTNNHPILRTFSWGNLSDYSRDTFITEYPALHVVPLPGNVGTTSTDMSFSILIYDLLNEQVGNPLESNQLDSMALTQEILNDFVNEFINQLTDFGYFLNTPVQYTPFVDRFAESVCGIEATITITAEQTACIPPFIVPCPTETIQQYLTTNISGSDIELDLYSDSGTTTATTALCNYSYSGWAQSDLGTIVLYNGFIQQGQTTKTIDTTSFFTGETLSSTSIYNITTTSCDCPTNINFTQTEPVYITQYQNLLTIGSSTFGYELPYITEKIKQNNLTKELVDNDIFNRLKGFFLFKLDTTNGGNPDWTLLNWANSIETQRGTLSVRRGYTTFPQFVSNKGWKMAPRNSIIVPQIADITLSTTGNTEGTYVVEDFGSTYQGGITTQLWGTNNNAWNRAIYGNTTRHSIFREKELTASYDFSGLGFKGITIDGEIDLDNVIVFNNNGVMTSVAKTGTDTGKGGGFLSLNGATEYNPPVGFNWTAGVWFYGVNMSSTLTQTFQQIITNYFNS